MTGAGATLDLAALRARFPALSRTVDGAPALYLDSAATSLKPRPVIDAVVHYDERVSANIHRGKHRYSEEASELYEDARRAVAAFLRADPRETIFTSGTTASINLVALGLPWAPGDNVVTSLQEHHANLLPWFDRAEVRLARVDDQGRIDADHLASLIDGRTRLVAVSHASNATGAIHDVRGVVDAAQGRGVPVLVDGAQGAAHLDVDVRALGCDFYAFSGHKLYGPTGIGVLWGRAERLEELGAPLRGGGMVRLVTTSGYTLKPLPWRLEPGTPPIAAAIGLAAAVRFIDDVGRGAIAAHEAALAQRLAAGLVDLPRARLLGPGPGAPRLPIASIVAGSKGLSADHVAMILSDTHGIMVRSGHHCCHPYFDSLGVPGSVRASFAAHDRLEDVDTFVAALARVLAVL